MNLIKSIIRKHYVKTLILWIIILLWLCCGFSKPILINAYYSAEVKDMIYKSNTVHIQLLNNGEIEGYYTFGGNHFRYTYVISGKYIYLYNLDDSNNVNLLHRLTIKNKFEIEDNQGVTYKVKGAEIEYYTLIGLNCLFGILTITFLVLDLRKSKKQKSNQIENKTKEEE